jgi:hypothetical protein
MRWSEFQEHQPRLAGIAADRLLGPGVVLVATICKDGSPRISAVEPFVLDGELWLCMLFGSRKAADLMRDPRLLVHSIITGREEPGGEVKVRGTARPVDDQTTHRRFADEVSKALPWSPEPGRFHLFALDLEQVTFITYNEDGDQHLVLWPQGVEQVRPITSATSLGEPTPVHEILS